MGPPIFSNQYLNGEEEKEYENIMIEEVDKFDHVQIMDDDDT